MKPPADLLLRLRAALSTQAGVVEKRMFGSAGFLVRGHLLAGCRPERVMFRIPPEQHERALQEPGVSPVIMRGKPYLGYVHVAAKALATDAQLQHWLQLALEHNAMLPPK